MMKQAIYQSILLINSLDEPTQVTLATAIALAEQVDAGLHLLRFDQATQNDPSEPAETSRAGIMMQTMAMQLALRHGLSITGSYQSGYELPVLQVIANKLRADLLVVGVGTGYSLHDNTTRREALQLLEHMSCPILTVPYSWQARPFRRLLLPVRPVPHALDKLTYLVPLLEQPDTELIVLGLYAPGEVISQQQLEELIAQLGVLLAKLPVTYRVEWQATDDMADTILTQASALTVDLVAVTAELTPSAEWLLQGPLVQQLLQEARTPLLCVRPNVIQQPVPYIMANGVNGSFVTPLTTYPYA